MNEEKALLASPRKKEYIKISGLFSPNQCRQIIDLAFERGLHRDEPYRKDGTRFAILDEVYLNETWISERILRAFRKANTHYQISMIEAQRPVRVHRYQRGHFVGWHRDRMYGPHTPVKLVIDCLLSNDFTGGELEVERPGRIVTLKAGDAIVFPGFTQHQVKKLKNGVRFSMSAGLYGPEWK